MKYIIFLLLLTFNLNAQEEVKLPIDTITNKEFRYYPNMEMYYDDFKTQTYLYKVNGEIIESTEKPKIGYSVFNGYFVIIEDYTDDCIFDLLKKHKRLYPYVSSKNRGNK